MSYREIVFPQKTTVVVTGGAGFIGSNLCEALLKKGCAVRCIDDLSTGREENMAGLSKLGEFHFFRRDIRDLDACRDICAGADYVFHEAAWGSVPRSVKLPLIYEEINIRGTLNMLEASREAGIKRFIYASSSSVYGDSQTLPKREGEEGAVLSPYALTKRADEEYAGLYTRLYGLQTVGLRYFNVFGRRQDPDSPYAAVIPRFIRQLLQGEQPEIHGNGLQSRDFTYIENVLEANLKACAAPDTVAGEVFNIAFGRRNTILGVYWNICAALGVSLEPKFVQPRTGDVRHSNASIEKAQKLLGYRPDYDFCQGLDLTIDWYRKHLA